VHVAAQPELRRGNRGKAEEQKEMSNWKWFGHAAHLIVGYDCRFHMATLLPNGYLVSTVGEYWPSRQVREIHARIHDPHWLEQHGALRGDTFDAAYMERFGFETIGCNRKYETMVFKAGEPCSAKNCNCGLPRIDGCELDFGGYNDAKSAADGHLELCNAWAVKEAGAQKGDSPK